MMKILVLLLTMVPAFVCAQNDSDKELFNNIAKWSATSQFNQVIQQLNQEIISGYPPDDAKWLYQRWARAYNGLGDYEKAVEIIDKHLKFERIAMTEEFSLRVNLLYARALYGAGHPQKSSKTFRRTQAALHLTGSYDIKYQAWLNYSLIEWDLGNFDKYVKATQKALDIARADNDSARQSLAHANLAEYYEVQQNWEEATRHLEEAARFVNRKTNIRKWAWLTIRQASYQSKAEGYNEQAIAQLKVSISLTDSANIYQYWKKASYELASIYYKNEEYAETEKILMKLHNDFRIQKNRKDLYEVKARLAQLYALTGDINKAAQYKRWLISNAGTIEDASSKVIGLHAVALVLQKQDSTGAARQIARDMFIQIENSTVTPANNRQLEARLIQMYQASGLEHEDRAHIKSYVRNKAVEKYITGINNVDWVFPPAGSSHHYYAYAFFLAIMGVIIYWMVNTRGKPSNSSKKVSYAEMARRIENS